MKLLDLLTHIVALVVLIECMIVLGSFITGNVEMRLPSIIVKALNEYIKSKNK